MSQENLEQFYKIIQSDCQLQEKLKTVTEPETFVKLLIELGKENGYSFTQEDVKIAIMTQAQVYEIEELSEREAELVAGGCPPDTSSGTVGACTSECGFGLMWNKYWLVNPDSFRSNLSNRLNLFGF